jgi:hypothetical protein
MIDFKQMLLQYVMTNGGRFSLFVGYAIPIPEIFLKK